MGGVAGKEKKLRTGSRNASRLPLPNHTPPPLMHPGPQPCNRALSFAPGLLLGTCSLGGDALRVRKGRGRGGHAAGFKVAVADAAQTEAHSPEGGGGTTKNRNIFKKYHIPSSARPRAKTGPENQLLVRTWLRISSSSLNAPPTSTCVPCVYRKCVPPVYPPVSPVYPPVYPVCPQGTCTPSVYPVYVSCPAPTPYCPPGIYGIWPIIFEGEEVNKRGGYKL